MKTKIKKFIKRLISIIKKPEMMMLPGQLAFFLFLAIIPTMTLLTYGASLLNLSMDFLHEFLTKAFSLEISDLILSTSTMPNAGINLFVVLFFCYYAASNGTDSVILSSNTIYKIENSSFLKRRFKAIFLSLIFLLILIFLLVVPLLGNGIISMVEKVNLDPNGTQNVIKVFNYLKSPIMFILVYLLVKIIYVVAPDKKLTRHSTTYGAIFTTISWILMTKLYAYYIYNLADYSALYGGLTSVSILMVWLYFICYIFVIGLGLNSQFEKEIEEKKHE